MSGKGEVPAGVEEQDVAAEAVHDASAEAGPNVKRRQVRPASNGSHTAFVPPRTQPPRPIDAWVC